MLAATPVDEKTIDYAPMVGVSLCILFGAVALYFSLSRGLTFLDLRGQLPSKLVRTIRNLLRAGLIVTVVLLLLQSLGLLQAVFTAVAGILAMIAIGFVAVWSVLSNALCSLFLMITRPFRVGDRLAFPPDNLAGAVVNFNMIFTTLETDDGFILNVPNNLFFQRFFLRKKGDVRIHLTEQLYCDKNATIHRDPEYSSHGETVHANGSKNGVHVGA